MRKSILTLALAAITSFSFATDKEKANGNYKVNSTASSVEWVGKKIGGQHNGNIKIASSDLILKDGMISGGKVVMDMATITCEDLKGEWSDKLVGHLKSDDFFGVEKHKTAEFVVKSVKPIAGAKAGDANYTVGGDLTIKGITHPVEFPATITVKDNNVVAIGDMVVDRSKYDVRYGSTSFFDNLGDKAIENNFSIKFKLAAKK
jgi:polyisoprenoid-binding protein YceI